MGVVGAVRVGAAPVRPFAEDAPLVPVAPVFSQAVKSGKTRTEPQTVFAFLDAAGVLLSQGEKSRENLAARRRGALTKPSGWLC